MIKVQVYKNGCTIGVQFWIDNQGFALQRHGDRLEHRLWTASMLRKALGRAHSPFHIWRKVKPSGPFIHSEWRLYKREPTAAETVKGKVRHGKG